MRDPGPTSSHTHSSKILKKCFPILLFCPSEAERRELYSEYHLGRQAWRLCKRGTKYCGWHREMPEFYEWRHMCLTYDGFKDLYKVFVDGVKIESGSWTGDRTFEGVR